ncbi:MAG: lycopene cyclase domain-containing protein [Flavobacteriales bacterium]|nr:lycopene cyclase domain-containing protein [Flavobacteriales bacterium]
MAGNYTYLLVDLGCILVPFIASFHPKLSFYKKFYPHVILALLGMMLLFIPWDIAFTKAGVWSFNETYLTGHRFLDLPLEEWFFFICIPFACLFTYACVRLFFPSINQLRVGWYLALGLVVLFLIVAFTHINQAYTFSAHFLCALLLIYHVYKRSAWLTSFFLMYAFVFPAFIASNGILTGLEFWQYNFILTDPTVVTDQIVWYNNEENLGIRIFSVPIDDISYGMLMLLMNVSVYEWVSRRQTT